MPTRSPSLKRVAAEPQTVDDADDLMPGNDVLHLRRQLAFDDVQVGAADAAGLDAHADLVRRRLRNGQIDAAAAARVSIGAGLVRTTAFIDEVESRQSTSRE